MAADPEPDVDGASAHLIHRPELFGGRGRSLIDLS
jgi:hypothetical protein